MSQKTKNNKKREHPSDSLSFSHDAPSTQISLNESFRSVKALDRSSRRDLFSVFVSFPLMSPELPGSAYKIKKTRLCRGRLTAAEPAGRGRRTWGAEEAAEGAARCLPAGRAAGSAGPAVSAGPAGAQRGLCTDRGPPRGPGWTPGSAGRSTGTGTSSAGRSSFQPPPAAPVPPPSASSTLSWRREMTLL